jgi:hypothetical protein
VSLTGNPVLQGRILDVVKGSVASATLFLSFLFLPVFGMIPGLFTPLPAVYYAVKQGSCLFIHI